MCFFSIFWHPYNVPDIDNLCIFSTFGRISSRICENNTFSTVLWVRLEKQKESDQRGQLEWKRKAKHVPRVQPSSTERLGEFGQSWEFGAVGMMKKGGSEAPSKCHCELFRGHKEACLSRVFSTNTSSSHLFYRVHASIVLGFTTGMAA